MSLKQTWTLTGPYTGGQDESSDLERKIDEAEAWALQQKRLGTQYNDPTCPGSLIVGWINECIFSVIVLCEPSGGCPALACASVPEGSVSHRSSVVARKAGFTPNPPPVDPPGNWAQNVQVNQNREGEKLCSSTAHAKNSARFSRFIQSTGLTALACLVWTPTDQLCDWEKMSVHRFCSVEMMELHTVQSDGHLMHSSFVWGY